MNSYKHLNDFIFLSVCYQQRRAREKDQNSIEKVKQIIAKIDQILVNNFKAGNICFDGVFFNQEESKDFLKRIIFSISIYGSCGREFFDEFSSHDVLSGSIKDEIFGQEISSMNLIQNFSSKFGGFDALSLTTFEDLDQYIGSLLELKENYKKGDRTEKTKPLFPTCYHESLIEEFEFRKGLGRLDLKKELTIEVNPCAEEFSLEKFIYQTIKKVQAYQAQSSNFACLAKADFKYPSIENFLTSYSRPPLYLNDPKWLFGRFVGLKIWDLQHENNCSTNRALILFTNWYNEKYPKYEINDESLKKYYETAKHAILSKDSFMLQNKRRVVAHNKKRTVSDPPNVTLFLKQKK